MSSTDVVVIVPMLGRPEHVAPLVRSLENSTDRARILWMVSAGDADVLDEVNGLGEVIILPRRSTGDYAHKINVGVLNSAEPLIFTGASDIRFHAGWLETAEACMSDEIGVVGTNDLSNPRTARGHSTHTLVARWYADLGLIDGTPGLLYEGYVHELVDDELVASARKRNAYAHCPDSHVEHLHPQWGKSSTGWDQSYRDQQRRMRQSAPEFARRRRLWT